MAHNSNYLRTVEDRRKPFDALVTQETVKRFERERVQVFTAVSMANIVTIENNAQIALAAFNNLLEWREHLTVCWRVTADYFATMSDRALREKYAKSTAPEEAKVRNRRLLEAWSEGVDRYIEHIGASKIKNITDTTMNDIRATVQIGMANKESVAQIAEDVNNLYREDIIPFRAPVIARTEVAAASNFGNRMAAKEFDKDILKRWVPVLDSRTRDSHAMMADSDWQPIDEPYRVGGELLMFPGDTTWGASAFNVVNCRCTEIFKPGSQEPSYDR
jgi:uncharacterized protein with gpF-like domain